MAKRGRPKSKGLGDTIAKITEATGIDRVVKAVVGDDCGCDERREKLNKMFPYVKETLTMTPDQISIYERIRPERLKGSTTREVAETLRVLRNSILKRNDKKIGCGSCAKGIMQRWFSDLEKVYQNQCNAD